MLRSGLRQLSSIMKVTALPANSDNYMYLIEHDGDAAVVDPCDAKRVKDEVEARGCKLRAVLTTHHHWDHAGGNAKMKEMFADLKIYGGCERVEAVTDVVADGETIKVAEGFTFKCIHTPCHTSSHICYYNEAERIVFTGDTLFIAGCGRFFEGTGEQMYAALVSKLGSLPTDTLVYVGHEYTRTNLKFASKVEPKNPDIADALKRCEAALARGEFTVPSTIEEEFKVNPFMRVAESGLRDFTGKIDKIDVMNALREAKNSFKV